MGLIRLYPSPRITTKCLLPLFGHSLCCWNKRDILIRTGSFHACWVAARRGNPCSRVALLGPRHLHGQMPCLPEEALMQDQAWVVPMSATATGSGCSPRSSASPAAAQPGLLKHSLPCSPKLLFLHQPSTQAKAGQHCLSHRGPETHSRRDAITQGWSWGS